MQNLLSHVLIIYDQPEPRQVLLTAATYCIGRDKKNSIVVPHRSISRQHALLLRMPQPERGNYRYRILDGSSTGKASLNGLVINGEVYSTYDLNPGDIIFLGSAIRIEYQTIQVPNNEKYFKYFNIESPQYQSIKSKPVNPHDTMVYAEELQEVSSGYESNLKLLENGDDFEDDFEDDSSPATVFFKKSKH
ncbi:MAG: FHA domain-containing protein [Thermosynechococcaceae cyanobacterium]